MEHEKPHSGEGMPGETTLSLLHRAKQGDTEALGRLCERYRPRLQRWASGRLPRNARGCLDTGDLVQDALLATIHKFDSFEPRHGGALQAYLYRVLRNRLHDEVKRVRSRPRQVEMGAEPVDGSASPLETVIGQDTLRRYEDAMDRLSDDDRAAVVMKVEWGFGHDEIAAELGKPSADAARMALKRALVRLAKEMGHE